MPEPANFRRGDRAAEVMAGYCRAVGAGDLDLGHEDVAGYPVSDLVADLCHLMQRHQLDPGEILAEGLSHYGADIIEQAWEHGDDWAPTLQDATNVGRALSILYASRVPAALHEQVLRLVGLVARDGA